jgi:protein-tyrosine phosphatase
MGASSVGKVVAHVLFVCTGNIFRSMTAEYALRRELGAASGLLVASAGTDDYPHVVRANVSDYLRLRGIDVSAHRRRTVTREMVVDAKLVVAMSTDHQRWLAARYGVTVPVFLEACGGACQALPDIEEVVLDYRTNAPAVDAHVRKTIDTILELTPRLALRIRETRTES